MPLVSSDVLRAARGAHPCAADTCLTASARHVPHLLVQVILIHLSNLTGLSNDYSRRTMGE